MCQDEDGDEKRAAVCYYAVLDQRPAGEACHGPGVAWSLLSVHHRWGWRPLIHHTGQSRAGVHVRALLKADCVD